MEKATIEALEHKLKKRKIIKIIVIALISFVIIWGLIGSYSVFHIAREEHNRSTIVIQKKRSILYFYRDTCPDCHKTFAQVLAAKDGGLPIQFINSMNLKNRKNFLKYDVKEVPTIILIDQKGNEIKRYAGTNHKKIESMLREVGGFN